MVPVRSLGIHHPAPGLPRVGLILALLAPLASGSVAAQSPGPLLPESRQVELAVTALPEEFRESATVLGYREVGGPLVELREGGGAFVCLADDPSDGRFHVPCYHRDLEPFMRRGREIRATGVTSVDEIDAIRYAEIESGALPMPAMAALYSRNAAPGDWEPATGEVRSDSRLYVIYVPGATPESTGLSPRPKAGEPWLMLPGTPKAHIMFTPNMGG